MVDAAVVREVRRCACGRRVSRYADRCGKCHDARMDAILAANRAEVASGRCPKCGSGLRRNLSLTGWWQCEQYGAEGRRARNDAPACSFQTFTERS